MIKLIQRLFERTSFCSHQWCVLGVGLFHAAAAATAADAIDKTDLTQWHRRWLQIGHVMCVVAGPSHVTSNCISATRMSMHSPTTTMLSVAR